MPGILLDTHALYWLVRGERNLSDEALVAIGESQQAGTVFVSPVSAWELAIATIKARADDRPDLGDAAPDRWFKDAVRAASAQVVPIRQRISCEAAKAVIDTGHKDPGDCFLIATARVKRIPIVTRDRFMRSLVATMPGYLGVIPC